MRKALNFDKDLKNCSPIKKQGLPIGLGRNFTLKHMKNHLGRTSYLEDFNIICTHDDIKQGKPDPKIYHLV